MKKQKAASNRAYLLCHVEVKYLFNVQRPNDVSQDRSGPGTVTSLHGSLAGWVRVRWDNDYENQYRMGADDKYDLQPLQS